MKPFGNRVLLRINKVYLFEEKKKPRLDEYGNHSYMPEQKATVVSSSVKELKKGMTVYTIVQGFVPINHLENKKYIFVACDIDDIVAYDEK